MKYYTLLITLLFNTNIQAEYIHPGTGNFFEVGIVQNRSVYKQQVEAPYGVPRFTYERLTLESTKLDLDIFINKFLTIGPMINYNFSPYDGNDGSSQALIGMKRSGFLDYGILTDVSVGVGQIMAQVTKGSNEGSGYITKLSFASGVPLLPFGNNHIWLNIMLEFTNYSSTIANYMYGVESSEVTESRPKYSQSSLRSFTQIYGLWTPIYGSLWFNLTYRLEKFEKEILNSPIVFRNYDQSALAGLMIAF